MLRSASRRYVLENTAHVFYILISGSIQSWKSSWTDLGSS